MTHQNTSTRTQVAFQFPSIGTPRSSCKQSSQITRPPAKALQTTEKFSGSSRGAAFNLPVFPLTGRSPKHQHDVYGPAELALCLHFYNPRELQLRPRAHVNFDSLQVKSRGGGVGGSRGFIYSRGWVVYTRGILPRRCNPLTPAG